MIKKVTLFILFFCVVTLTKAQQRGFKEVNVTISGASQTLYKQSHALVIGISDYTAGWPDLPGVKNDITAVKTALEKHDFDVTLLENATKEQMDKSISDFISKYGQGSNNRLLFYFAGHGHTIKTSYGDELGYIVPVDAPNPNKDAAGFQAKAIEMVDFEKYAKRIQSKHALFLFDACFSGSLFALSRAAPEIISYKTSQPVRQFITSGSANETVPDVSIFRKQFVTAITTSDADANKDGYLTCTELGDFLQTSVVNYSYNTQHPQYGKIRNPNLDKGDFVFVINQQTPKPVDVAVKPISIGQEEVLVYYGSLELTTELSGNLYIDGSFVKTISADTKIPINNLTTGSHTIEIKGSENWKQQVTITKDQKSKIEAKTSLITEVNNEQNTLDNNKNIEPENEKPIYTVVEEMPSYPGGDEARIKFLVDNTKYPQIAKESGIQGTVYVTFVVDEKGKVDNVKVLRGIGGGCDEEAIRVVKLMPAWNPGKQSGKPVRVQFNMPIRFSFYESNNPNLNSIEYNETAFGLNMKMVKIKGGTFTMGSPSSEADRASDETQHSVTLSDFYIGKYEVTVGQFKKFIDDNGYRTDAEKEGWSYVWTGSTWEKKNGATWKCDVSGSLLSTSEYDHPVIHVSWNDAKAYCAWLSGKTGKKYSLPTEAQWEYACRAGTTTPFNTGNCLSSTQANYDGNYPYASCSKGDYKGKTVPVGSYLPNAWGLYDMHGNVWEWCADYCNYEKGKGVITDTYKSGVTDPLCNTGSGRVNRGGSWYFNARNCRSAIRNSYTPDYRSNNLGFRLVCVP